MNGLEAIVRAEGAAADRLPAPVRAIFVLVFLTSSFDIFLNLRIAGFSLRFCYLLILLLAFLYAPYLHRLVMKRSAVPGWAPLLIWTLFLAAFIPNTSFVPRSVGYMGWHVIHLIFIFLLTDIVNSRATFFYLFRAYVVSFFAISVFGLIQFAAGLLGVDLLVRQWWINGRLPRINGFSYEPSYYGSYLIIGWILLFTLYMIENKVFPKRKTGWMLAIVTASLFLSSSRMSIAVAALFIAFGLALAYARLLATLKIARIWLAISLIGLLSVTAGVTVVASQWAKYKFLFDGLGIGGTATHSTVSRYLSLQQTFDVFLRSPVIGVSLGGVAPGIAEGHNVEVSSNEDAKQYEGVNIFVEVLAASGVIAFPFFCAYLIALIAAPLGHLRRGRPGFPDQKAILTGLLLGLVFELLILTMNQNILRAFLWIHIALLSLACKMARDAYLAGSGTREESSL